MRKRWAILLLTLVASVLILSALITREDSQEISSSKIANTNTVGVANYATSSATHDTTVAASSTSVGVNRSNATPLNYIPRSATIIVLTTPVPTGTMTSAQMLGTGMPTRQIVDQNQVSYSGPEPNFVNSLTGNLTKKDLLASSCPKCKPEEFHEVVLRTERGDFLVVIFKPASNVCSPREPITLTNLIGIRDIITADKYYSKHRPLNRPEYICKEQIFGIGVWP